MISGAAFSLCASPTSTLGGLLSARKRQKSTSTPKPLQPVSPSAQARARSSRRGALAPEHCSSRLTAPYFLARWTSSTEIQRSAILLSPWRVRTQERLVVLCVAHVASVSSDAALASSSSRSSGCPFIQAKRATCCARAPSLIPAAKHHQSPGCRIVQILFAKSVDKRVGNSRRIRRGQGRAARTMTLQLGALLLSLLPLQKMLQNKPAGTFRDERCQ